MSNSVRAGLIAFTVAAALTPLTARADDAAELADQAQQAMAAIFAAIATGDASRVEPLLAPEFQVMRSDGKGYNKADYLAQSLPKITAAPTFSNIVATRDGDIVVVRVTIDIIETINGKKADRQSPQLMVFRVTPGGWEVVAAANFAKLK